MSDYTYPLTSCPECGGRLQATVAVWVNVAAIHEGGVIRASDLSPAFSDTEFAKNVKTSIGIEALDPHYEVYCENDCDLTPIVNTIEEV